MADLIDKQKTLEKIYQLQPFPIIDRDAYDFYRDVRESIKSMPSAQQWTPVSEGLPEKEVEVLVTTSWGNVCMAWCDNGKWRAEYINGYDDDEILAWMPLPEPFKGGDGE